MSERVVLYRELLAWAKANGWHRHAPQAFARSMGDYEIVVDWGRTGGAGRVETYRINHAGPVRVTELFEYDRIRNTEQGIDLLVALNYLPAQFSSAYRDGWHEGFWQSVDQAVDARLEDLFLRVEEREDEIRTMVGDRLDDLLTGGDPFTCRAQRARIADAIVEILDELLNEAKPKVIGAQAVRPCCGTHSVICSVADGVPDACCRSCPEWQPAPALAVADAQ